MERKLNFLDVFSIASGAMISSGIFVLPAIAYNHTGSSLFISYLIGGIIALIGILSIAELSSAMPKAGGDYYFISRSFGPLMGTINGFLSWFALSLKSAFAIYGLSGVFQFDSLVRLSVWQTRIGRSLLTGSGWYPHQGGLPKQTWNDRVRLSVARLQSRD